MATRLTGKKMAFTWSLTTEGPQTEEFGHAWTLVGGCREHDTTPENTEGWEETTKGLFYGELLAEFWIDSGATPKIPIGALGVAVLFLDLLSGSRSYTVQAICTRMVVLGRADAPGNLQVVRYSFRVSPTNEATGTQTAGIVVA